MQDYSFHVPIFGGHQTILMNGIEVVFSERCVHCGHRLDGAVVAVGSPLSALAHRQCMQFIDYARGWPHEYTVHYYRDRSLVGLGSRGKSPPGSSSQLTLYN